MKRRNNIYHSFITAFKSSRLVPSTTAIHPRNGTNEKIKKNCVSLEFKLKLIELRWKEHHTAQTQTQSPIRIFGGVVNMCTDTRRCGNHFKFKINKIIERINGLIDSLPSNTIDID